MTIWLCKNTWIALKRVSRIITNTSPVIALSMIKKLYLLWELFEDVYVPMAVIKELTESPNELDHGRQEILNGIQTGKIIPYSVQDEMMVQSMYGKLHKGELETIIGGIELKIEFVLIDEVAARNMAKNFFLTPIGTLGILRLAKAQKKIEING
ncbi:DUF3368 domain-containing protein [Jeotgalibacillus malaysiensis]|uniref:DUF3368 domain-containing protein n=1 Tax=Jeotgalibacillus malaysiensis TaxID=1508404 RepID=UPI00384D34B3